MHRRLIFRLVIIKLRLSIYTILPLPKNMKVNLAEKRKKELIVIMKITDERIKELLKRE